jgi:hypothetical protein
MWQYLSKATIDADCRIADAYHKKQHTHVDVDVDPAEYEKWKPVGAGILYLIEFSRIGI